MLQQDISERFNVLNTLGSGASGDVLLGESIDGSVRVAIKAIKINTILKLDPKAKLLINEI